LVRGKAPGLGEDSLEALATTLMAVEENPEAYPVVHRRTRRAFLRRFPYGVYYRVRKGGVVVVASFHAKRNPRTWRARS